MTSKAALRVSIAVLFATMVGACHDTTGPSAVMSPSSAVRVSGGVLADVTEVPPESPAREVPADEPQLADVHGSHFTAASLGAAVSNGTNPVSIGTITEFGGHLQSAVLTTVQQGFPTNGSSYLVFSSGDARVVGAAGSFSGCSADSEFGTLCDRGGLRIQVAVPASANDLKFDYRYFAVDYAPFEDPFQVFIEAGGVTTRVVRATLSSEIPSKPAGSTALAWGPMRQAVINVVAYRGQTITLRFQASDRSDQINSGGALVDNMTFGAQNTAPSITAPIDLSFDNDAGVCQATVALLGEPTVTDDGEYDVGEPTRSDGAAFDAPYPVGTTTLTWTVTDAGGLSASDQQTVTVSDVEAPTVTAPADITVATDAGQPYATVNPPAGTAADNCPGVTVTDPPSATYPIGTTTVTYVATDGAGLQATADLDITVVDQENPTLTVPANFSVDATMPGGAVVTFSTSATDNSGSATVSCGRTSGSTFPIGATTVTCTATDDSGNSVTGSFTVTVIGARAQIEDLIAQVTSLSLHNGTSQPLLSMLATALRDPGATAPEVACIKLDDFIFKLQDHKSVASISQVTIDEMIADSQRIQNVLGCP